MPLSNINDHPHSLDIIKKLIHTKIVILDIGAAGGVMDEWQPINTISKFYGFEPRTNEANRLNSQSPNNQKYFPYALSNKKVEKIFYNCVSSAASGFYPDNEDFSMRFSDNLNYQVKNTFKINCTSLDEMMHEFNQDNIDLIKLDTEGSELEILEGSKKCLDQAFAILTEVHFSKHQKTNGQYFSKIDKFLQDQNFFLYDLNQTRFTKKTLPVGKIFNLGNFSFAGDYQKAYGMVKMADALYFRDPIFDFQKDKAKAEKYWDNEKILKLIIILDLYNYHDSAIEILISFKNRFNKIDFEKILSSLIKFNPNFFTLENFYVRKNYLRNKFLKSLIAKYLCFTQKITSYKKYLNISNKIYNRLNRFK